MRGCGGRERGGVPAPARGQAAVPRLVAELWGLPFMSDRDAHARDGAAGSLLEAFDFEQPPRPPLLLATRACP